MEYIYIGTIVNTHGIKGEIRILSDAEYKEYIFIPNNHLYIGDSKMMKTIHTYRKHKIYDMVTLEGLYDINDVLCFKGENVYIKRDEISFPSFLKQDLIGMDVISNDYKGKVTTILNSKAHSILVVEDKHRYLIPYVDELIEKIDFEQKKIYIKEMKGLFDEN